MASEKELRTMRKRVSKTPHEHMLLWNLKACRGNAKFHPFADSRERNVLLVPMYEDELRSRNYEVPENITTEVLDKCLDRMVADGRCKPKRA